GGKTMRDWIGRDPTHGIKRLVGGGERQQTIARGNDFAPAGVLHDARSASSQVIRAALREPSAPRPNEGLLVDSHFASASSDVVAEGPDRRRRNHRIDHAPAAPTYIGADVVRCLQRDLEVKAGAAG